MWNDKEEECIQRKKVKLAKIMLFLDVFKILLLFFILLALLSVKVSAQPIGLEVINNTYIHTWNNGTIEPNIYFNISSKLDQFANALDRFTWVKHSFGVGYISSGNFTELVNKKNVVNTILHSTDNLTYWYANNEFSYAGGQRRFLAGFNNSQLVNDDYMTRTAYINPTSTWSFNADLYYFWEFYNINIGNDNDTDFLNYNNFNGTNSILWLNKTSDLLEAVPSPNRFIISDNAGIPYIDLWTNETDIMYIYFNSVDKSLKILRDIPDSYISNNPVNRTFYWIDALSRVTCPCTITSASLFFYDYDTEYTVISNDTIVTNDNITMFCSYGTDGLCGSTKCDIWFDHKPFLAFTEMTENYSTTVGKTHGRISVGVQGYVQNATAGVYYEKNITVGGRADNSASAGDTSGKFRCTIGKNQRAYEINITPNDTLRGVSYSTPVNNSYLTTFPQQITCNCTDDTQVRNCTVKENFTGTWKVNKSSTYTVTGLHYKEQVNVTIFSLPLNRTYGYECITYDVNLTGQQANSTGILNIFTYDFIASIDDIDNFLFAIVIGLILTIFTLIYASFFLNSALRYLFIILSIFSLFGNALILNIASTLDSLTAVSQIILSIGYIIIGIGIFTLLYIIIVATMGIITKG